MGRYLNPQTESKESFLRRVGTEAPSNRITMDDIPEGCKAVVHVDNGPFTAALVIENEGDLEASLDPSDTRPMKIFFVKDEDLEDSAPRDSVESFRRIVEKGEFVRR